MKHIIIKLSSLVLMLIMLIPSVAQANQTENLQVIYVSAETAECTGVAPQTCLQIKSSPEAEWEFWYDGIINFQHERGVEYTLLVRVIAGDPNLADASSFHYQLVQVLNRTVVGEDFEGFSSLYEATGEFSLIYVASETVDCVGVGPQTCMQIRFSADGEWEYFYDTITDFEYQAGYEYQLVVQRANLTAENIADVSSFAYRLDRIIDKVQIGAEVEPEQPTSSLNGTSWTLDGYEIAGEFVPVQALVNITIDFAGNQFSGSAGCNNYSGTYRVEGNQLIIDGAIISTRMACVDEVIMENEARFLETLPLASMFIIDGTLRIQFADGSFMVFSPSGGEETGSLDGTAWIIDGFEVDGVFEPLVNGGQDRNNDLSFRDGEILAYAGCNGIFGNYGQDGSQLVVTELGSTLMYCSLGETDTTIMDQEDRVSNALSNATSFTIDGDTLRIQFGEGEYLVLSPAGL